MAGQAHDQGGRTGAPVAFGVRYAGSETFRALFREGMALVEETAAYLDGDGRTDSRSASRLGVLTYATESMRLTSRLMQLASWLLLQRAVNEGEIGQDQARVERAKVRLRGFESVPGGPGWADLPDRLQDLVARSLRLQSRIRTLDEAIYDSARRVGDNPVGRAIGRLAAAFGPK